MKKEFILQDKRVFLHEFQTIYWPICLEKNSEISERIEINDPVIKKE